MDKHGNKKVKILNSDLKGFGLAVGCFLNLKIEDKFKITSHRRFSDFIFET